jgi:nitrogen fixation protein NifB
MALDLARHPCFNDAVRHTFGRVHLPVAPDCNVQCNFCDRRYNCVNESRPGVTTAVLSPHQAIAYLDDALARDPRIAVTGIAGPGDPFASPAATLQTLRLVRERYPEMLLCVASNGLNVADHVPALADVDVSHVTLTVNAVDPEIGARIYAWIRDGKRPFRGVTAARILLQKQLEAIRLLKAHEILVKINAIIIPGVNDQHLEQVAECLAELGADVLNCVPLYPVANTPFAGIAEPSPQLVADVRCAAGQHLPLMHHCTRCRADAVGLLGEAMGDEHFQALSRAAAAPLMPDDDRPYVAVATMEGVLVNLHLGEAASLAIYAADVDGPRLIETRPTPPRGTGGERWAELAEQLSDCRAVLVTSAGAAPSRALAERGIRVVMMEGLIDEGLEAVLAGQAVRAPLRREHRCGSGASCSGNGLGCG